MSIKHINISHSSQWSRIASVHMASSTFILFLVIFPTFSSAVLPGTVTPAVNKYDGKQSLAVIKKRLLDAGYTKYVTALNSTGFWPIFENLLNNYEVTVLAPSNMAFVRALTLKADMANLVRRRQIMAYHIIGGRNAFNFLRGVPVRTQFISADYNQVVEKLNTPAVLQFGAVGSKVGAKIITPDVFVNYKFAIMGVDNLMKPPQYFKS